MLLFKNSYLLIILIGFVSSCSEGIKKNEAINGTYPTSIEQALEEIEDLLSLVNKNLLVLDSTQTDSIITTQNLECIANTCRSEVKLGSIVLKKVFKCNNGTINTVHYDLYYDSLTPGLEKDIQNAINLIDVKFGIHNSIYNSGTMKTYSWIFHRNIIDLESFNNGFTLPLEKVEGQNSEQKLP